MIYLGIDSSAVSASAAICEINGGEKKIKAYGSINAAITHSETLVPLMESLLKSAHIQLSEIDCFAVSNGPGSFTGLRISVSVIKGMAYALEKPVRGVSTLLSLVYNLLNIDFFGIACPVMDARCGQVYNALFKVENEKITRLTEDRALSIEDLEKELKSLYPNEKIMLIGDGTELTARSMTNPNINLTPPLLRFQNAVSVCFAAAETGHEVFASGVMPSYLRLPQAERERLNKRL